MAYNIDNINIGLYSGPPLPQNLMIAHSASITPTVSHGQMNANSSRQSLLHVPTIQNTSNSHLSQNPAPGYIIVPTTSNIPQTTLKTSTSTTETKLMKPQILEKMRVLRDLGKYCDLTIDVKGVRFHAHRNILAAWSPYFDSQLLSDDQHYIKDLLIVNYDGFEVFSDLLDFLYSGTIAPRETNFLQLLHLAVSFQIDLLKHYCEEFLRSNLHLGNFISTYFLSRKYNLKSLEEFIVNFIKANLSDVVKQPEFLSLSAERFNAILSKGFMEELKPEIKLFLIISWIGFDVRERERVLVLLLGHIDWSTVASDFLLEISRTENFFTTHESSLYLLLQTLFSSGISLGPYVDHFPTLRQTYSHLLSDIIHTTLQVRPDLEDDFYPVTVSAMCTKFMKSDVCIGTDNQSGEHMGRVVMATPQPVQELKTNIVTREVEMQEYIDDFSECQNEGESSKDDNDQKHEDYLMLQERSNKRKGQPRRVKLIISVPPEKQSVEENGESVSPTKSPAKGTSSGGHAKMIKTSPKKGQNRKKKGRGKKSIKKEEVIETKTEAPEIEENDTDQENKIEEIQNDEVQKAEQEEAELDEWRLQAGGGEEEMYMSESDDEWVPEKREGPKPEKDIKTRKRRQTTNYRNASKQKSRTPGNTYHDCPHCEYKSTIPGRLDNHIRRSHESNMTYKCTICDYITKWNKKYYEHMRLKHFEGPPFHCDFCDFAANKIHILLSHRTIHKDERPHSCDLCPLRFRTRNNLLAHVKSHSGLRPFACEDCGKCFATKNTLDQHSVTHSNDRPYLCDKCGFSTKYQSHLIAHKRIHTGNTFPCSYPKCNYTTPKRSQLKQHMRSHLQIRSFSCETCGKSFIEKSHLIRHEKIHLADKPFKCSDPSCEYATSRPDKLKEHNVKYHNPDSSTKTVYKQRKPKVRKVKEIPPAFPHYDHAAYTMPADRQHQPPTHDFQGFIQDIRMHLASVNNGSNMSNNIDNMTIVPIISDQMVSVPISDESSGQVVNTIVTTPSSIIPEDHQSYVSLNSVQHQVQDQTQIQGANVPMSQAVAQNQDYSGLNAFMALF